MMLKARYDIRAGAVNNGNRNRGVDIGGKAQDIL